MSRDKLNSTTVCFGNVSIPFSRLGTLLQRGDIITTCVSRISTPCEFRITHVAWWGVYGMVTEESKESMCKFLNKDFVRERCKGHFKIKWCNVWKIIFQKLGDK